METFYDGEVVNAIMTRATARREHALGAGRARRLAGAPGVQPIAQARRKYEGKVVTAEEKMPDGRLEMNPKDEASGDVTDVVVKTRRVLTHGPGA